MSIPVIILACAVALAVGIALGRRVAGRQVPSVDTGETSAGRDRDGLPGGDLRSRALDASLEAILIISPDGRIVDCNAAALAFFDRHRSEVIGMDAVAIRRLYSGNGRDLVAAAIAASRTPWLGDGLARLPDGSTRQVVSRAIPLFGDGGNVVAVVEVHRDPGEDASPTTRFPGFPHSALMAHGGDADRPGARRDLRFLAAAFHDIERVLRQYQRLLPALRAEDPLSEVIAGVAAETTDVAQSVDVPTLLREIPVALARLDAQVRQCEDDARGAVSAAHADGPVDG